MSDHACTSCGTTLPLHRCPACGQSIDHQIIDPRTLKGFDGFGRLLYEDMAELRPRPQSPWIDTGAYE